VFDEEFPERDLELPESMRAELAKPIGRVVSSQELKDLVRDSPRVIAVGDVVTITLLQMDAEPDVAIFDYRTRRSEGRDARQWIPRMKGRLVKVENPAGRITPALWRAVRDAARGKEKVKIEVSGEEDLGALVAIATAPEGAHVVYGIPGRGVTVVRVQQDTREIAVSAIKRMAG
jgi:hypothetical protein